MSCCHSEETLIPSGSLKMESPSQRGQASTISFHSEKVLKIHDGNSGSLKCPDTMTGRGSRILLPCFFLPEAV